MIATQPAVSHSRWQLAPTSAPAGSSTAEPDVHGLAVSPSITVGDLSDAMSALYALVDAQGNTEAKDAQVDISWREHDRRQAIEQEAAAQQRVRDAEGDGSKGFFSSIVGTLSDAVSDLAKLDFSSLVKDSVKDTVDMWQSPNFWKDLEVGASYVTTIAAIVGSSVVTCGAAGPLVAGIAIALSAGGFTVEKTHCLDGLLGKGASDWIGLGLEAGGAALGGGSTMLAQGSTGWAASVTKAAKLGAAGAAVVGGLAHGEVQHFAARALDAQADTTADQNKAEQMQRLVDWVIDALKDTSESHQSALATVRETLGIVDQTRLAPLLASGGN